MRIRNKITFEVRANGLYRSVDRQRWRRVARDFDVAVLVFDHGRLEVLETSLSDRRQTPERSIWDDDEQSPAVSRSGTGGGAQDAIAQVVRDHCARLDGIYDLTASRDRWPTHDQMREANGFIVYVPGSGSMLAITPEALRSWFAGSVPPTEVLADLDARGWLIRGADGQRTRQVLIPALGRRRYYCLKLEAGGPELLAKSRAVKRSRRPTSVPRPPRDLPPEPQTPARRSLPLRAATWRD